MVTKTTIVTMVMGLTSGNCNGYVIWKLGK